MGILSRNKFLLVLVGLCLLARCVYANELDAGPGVSKIIAGSNIVVDPAEGTGDVTVSASGGAATSLPLPGGASNYLNYNSTGTLYSLHGSTMVISSLTVQGVNYVTTVGGSTQTKSDGGLNIAGRMMLGGMFADLFALQVFGGSITVADPEGLSGYGPGGGIFLKAFDTNHGITYSNLGFQSSDAVDGVVVHGYNGGRLATKRDDDRIVALSWKYPGRVGIPTNSPQVGLDVSTTARFTAKVGLNTTAPSSELEVVNGSVTIRGTNAGLAVGGQNFVVQNGGNVGIGAQPLSRLDVAGGSVTVRQSLEASSASFINESGAGLQVSSNSYLGMNGGFVGVGLSNPANSFVIFNASIPTLSLTHNGTAPVQHAIFNMFTQDVNTNGSLESGDKAWHWSARSSSFVTTAERNFLYLWRYGNVVGGFERTLSFDFSNGNMGVGTQGTPLAKFDVLNGSVSVRGTNARVSIAKPSGGGSEKLLDVGGSTFVVLQNGFVGVSTDAPAATLHLIQSNNGPGNGFRIQSASSTWELVMEGGGSGGDGDLAVYHDGGFVGQFRTTGQYVPVSDANLKKDVVNVATGTLTLVGTLRPVTYHMVRTGSDKPKETGFLAQDVGQVFPDLVRLSANGTCTLDYNGLLALTVKAVQELKAQNDDLKNRVAILEGLIP